MCSFWSHALRHKARQDVFEGSPRAQMLLVSEGSLLADKGIGESLANIASK